MLAVNLSDLAAMGAKPAWFTLALTMPEVDTDWLAAFVTGLSSLASQYALPLVGGGYHPRSAQYYDSSTRLTAY